MLFKFRKWFKYGLKTQKLLTPGIALGIIAINKAPCKDVWSLHAKLQNRKDFLKKKGFP